MNTLKRMFEIQDSLNIVTAGEDWAQKGLDWRLAITQECSELIDSLPWKWWKHGSFDIENVKIEIVDIWHFILSIMIEEDIVPTEILEEQLRIAAGAKSDDYDGIINFSKELIVKTLTIERGVDLAMILMNIAGKAGMNYDEIMKIYIGKSVLNNFRQLNGYSDGAYKKVWDGKEDNEVMMEIVGAMKYAEYDNSFEEKLMNELTERYMIVE